MLQEDAQFSHWHEQFAARRQIIRQMRHRIKYVKTKGQPIAEIDTKELLVRILAIDWSLSNTI